MNKLFLAAILLFISFNGICQYQGTTDAQYLQSGVIDFSHVGSVYNEQSNLSFSSTNPHAQATYTEIGVWGINANTDDIYFYVIDHGTGQQLSDNYSWDRDLITELHYYFAVNYADGTWESISYDYYF